MNHEEDETHPRTSSLRPAGGRRAGDALVMRPEPARARPGYGWQPGCHCSPPTTAASLESSTTPVAQSTATSAGFSSAASLPSVG